MVFFFGDIQGYRHSDNQKYCKLYPNWIEVNTNYSCGNFKEKEIGIVGQALQNHVSYSDHLESKNKELKEEIKRLKKRLTNLKN